MSFEQLRTLVISLIELEPEPDDPASELESIDSQEPGDHVPRAPDQHARPADRVPAQAVT